MYMKIKRKLLAIVQAILLLSFSLWTKGQCVPIESATLHGNELIKTEFGDIHLNETYLTKESITKLNEELELERAISIYQWSIPLTTFGMWYNAHHDVYGGTDLDFVEYVSFNEKSGIVTANSNTPYVISWGDLSRTGPVIMNYPAGPSAGGVANFFQLSIGDLGLVGADKGKGGKYLIVPPGYDKSKLNTTGYFVLNATTNKIMIGTRFLSADEAVNQKMKQTFLVGKYGEPMKAAKFISNTTKVLSVIPSEG